MKKVLLFATVLAWMAGTADAQTFLPQPYAGEIGQSTVAAATFRTQNAAPKKVALADNQRFAGLYTSDSLSARGYGFTSLSMDLPIASYWPPSVFDGVDGMQAKGIRVGLVAAATVKQVTLYGIKADNSVATIKTQTPANTGFGKGWTTVLFDEPWTIDTKGYNAFLVGFTYTQKTGTTSDCTPWSLVKLGSIESTYVYGNLGSAGETWYNAGTNTLGNLGVQIMVEGNFTASWATPYDFAKVSAMVNDSATVNIKFRSWSKSPITDIDYVVTIDGQAAAPVHQALSAPVAPGSNGSFVFKMATGSEPAVKKIAVELTHLNAQVNGAPDKVANGQLGIAQERFPRNVFIEEFTTEKCPNCPRVAGYLHTALQTADKDRVFAVAHHSAYYTDWLTQPCDEDLTYLYNDGGTTYAPALMFNRRPYFAAQYPQGTAEADNVMIPSSANEITTVVNYELNNTSDARLSLRAVPNADTTQVVLTVKGECNEAFDEASNYLTVYMTEDSIQAKSQVGATGKFYHQHVIRYFNSSWGDALTWTDKEFTRTYTIDVNSNYKKRFLKFVALLNRYNPDDVLDNAIENVNGTTILATSTGISGVASDAAAVKVVARYNAAGQLVDSEQKGLNIVKLSNGKVLKYAK